MKESNNRSKFIKKMLAEFREKRTEKNARVKEKIEESKKRRKEELREILATKDKEEPGKAASKKGENAQKEGEIATAEEEAKKEKSEEQVKEKSEEEEEAQELESLAKEEKEVEENEITEKDILGVIENHPEGIKLSKIGNKLGVHHIAIANQVNNLLDKGQIEKKEGLYKLID